jgi:hypothetical protein
MKGGNNMPKKRYSKEIIIKTIKNLAENLGRSNLSQRDVEKIISLSTVRNHFGSLGRALEAAGISGTDKNKQLETLRRKRLIPEKELFQSIHEVEEKIGHEPSYAEYSANGKYSDRPFRKRFGRWEDTLRHYRKWKTDSNKDGIHIRETTNIVANEESAIGKTTELKAISKKSRKEPPQLYGEPINFRGLRHAPINEQGVVFLFGMVSQELGFNIEAIQQGFPDCEGKYLYDDKKNLWAKARIEFEYKSSAFREHGHNPEECDYIVCWINDWSDCPISVIELRTEIPKLHST